MYSLKAVHTQINHSDFQIWWYDQSIFTTVEYHSSVVATISKKKVIESFNFQVEKNYWLCDSTVQLKHASHILQQTQQ